MNKLFCVCGQPTFYQLKKPNVCSSCGKLFNVAFKREAKVNELSAEDLAKSIKDIVKNELIKNSRASGINIHIENNEYEEDEQNSALKHELMNIAKASAKRVKVSVAKNPTLEDLKNVKDTIKREQRNKQTDQS